MYDVLRFWLDRGVDGFRVDVLWRLIKDAHFRDDPPNPDFREGEPPYRRLLPLYSSDQPEALEITAQMRQVLDKYPGERLLIGEIYLPVHRLVAYYGPNLMGAHLPFNFNLMWVEWKPAATLQLIREYEATLPPGAWPSWVLGNHDQRRIASRLGPAQARVAMVLLLTLRGTPTLYYGDELGLRDVPIPREQLRDPFGRSLPRPRAGPPAHALAVGSLTQRRIYDWAAVAATRSGLSGGQRRGAEASARLDAEPDTCAVRIAAPGVGARVG